MVFLKYMIKISIYFFDNLLRFSPKYIISIDLNQNIILLPFKVYNFLIIPNKSNYFLIIAINNLFFGILCFF